MTDLIYITLPLLGRIYAQRDTLTTPRLSVELLHSTAGRELLLCCGCLRLYLTPASALASEGR